MILKKFFTDVLTQRYIPNVSDVPGCRENECYPGVQCHDVPAPGAGFTCGPCPPGYQGDGFTCSPGGSVGLDAAMRVEL